MVFKGTLRAVKNVTNGYSDVEAKVRTATSNDNTLPSGAQMHELAQMSYNHEAFIEIVAMLDKRLNDKGKYWRHVYKVQDGGSPQVAQYFRDNIYLIKTLTEFQHIDDSGRDVGTDVRARARELSRLLADDKSLVETRRRRKHMRDRMAGRQVSESDDEKPESPRHSQQPKKPSREEQDMRRAMELSEQDETERRRRLAEQGREGLFDDPKSAPSNLIDLTIDESRPWQLQPQFTSLPPQMAMSYAAPSMYDPSAVQAQFTAFDPYAQQAQYEALLQAEYTRQQAEAAEQQQQQQYYDLQLQAAQFQAAQLQAPQPPLASQKTIFGSNNPFASNNPFGQPSSPPVPTPQLPQSLSPAPSATATPALVQGRPPSSTSVSSHASSLPPRTPISARADALSAVLASAGPGGIDTFGNVGQLRYGSSAFGMVAQRTGAGTAG
ncbi:hypothetical protein BJV78DRAFT_1273557 [Lactifluus subvellereus]|nr:hypothetical protein BJV78DRAFT_1273557 [Lactifluus subvellereus]